MAVIIFLLALLAPSVAWADTHTAASCSYSDVNTALGATSAGDTLSIPAGDCTWSSILTVDKELIVQGAGATGGSITKISGTPDPLIHIHPTTDVPVRVTGIYFNVGASDDRAVTIDGTMSSLRIDHCYFYKGQNTVYTTGGSRIWGVIDNNTFYNSGTVDGRGALYLRGDNDTAWTRTIAAGTAAALFVESNAFTIDNNRQSTTQDSQVYIQEGASVVVRYNTFDATGWTDSFNFMTFLTNNHGNQCYYSYGNDGTCGNNGGCGFRASPIFEFYNNTVSAYRVTQFHGIRGGSVLIHDNSYTITGPTAPSEIHKFTEEEEVGATSFFPTNYERLAWPAQDQLTNSFIWNEAYSGPAPNYGSVSGGYVTGVRCANSTTFCTEDRDYFMHAPEASGGSTSYTGSRKGASTTFPTGDGDACEDTTGSDTVFTASGANAYYPYTAYTYPHPLRGESAPAGGSGDTTLGAGGSMTIGSGGTITLQ